MITINYKGGFGNTLFQYALARIISEDYGHSILHNKPNRVSNNCAGVQGDRFDWSHINNNGSIKFFKNTINYNGTDVKIRKNNIGIDDSNFFNFRTICENHNDKNIFLDGWLQNYDVYKDSINSIRKWFQTNEDDRQDNDTLTIHVRLGDFIIDTGAQYCGRGILTYKFYKNFIANNFKKINVVTHTINHEIIKNLANNFDCKIICSNNFFDDFLFLTKSSNLLVSHSTFAWWAAILCNNTVYYPFPKFIGKRRFELKPTNLNNYMFIDVNREDYLESSI